MRHKPLITPVRRYGGRFGFDEYFTTGRRVQVRRQTIKQAQQAATSLHVLVANGRKDLAQITHAELAQFRQWKSLRDSSVTVNAAIAEFIQEKIADNEIGRKWRRVLSDYLRNYAGEFGQEKISDSTALRMEKWMRDLRLSKVVWNNLRSAIVQLHRWARAKCYLPDQTTEAERIKRFKIKKTADITHWEPAEMQQQIMAAGDDDRPWYLLGGFAGVRTEELMPEYKDKDPLRWEDFDWDERIIRMRPETSKVNEARNIPLSGQLLAWLQPYRARSGPCIAIGRRPRVITKRVERSGGLPHRINANRHSYGIYRRMECLNIEQVAEEMGTGIYKVKTNYSRPKNPSALRAWKSIMPADDSKIIALPKSQESHKKRDLKARKSIRKSRALHK